MTKKIAHTMLGRLRQAASTPRVRKVTGFGFKFLAAARESGSDNIVPNTVHEGNFQGFNHPDVSG